MLLQLHIIQQTENNRRESYTSENAKSNTNCRKSLKELKEQKITRDTHSTVAQLCNKCCSSFPCSFLFLHLLEKCINILTCLSGYQSAPLVTPSTKLSTSLLMHLASNVKYVLAVLQVSPPTCCWRPVC